MRVDLRILLHGRSPPAEVHGYGALPNSLQAGGHQKINYHFRCCAEERKQAIRPCTWRPRMLCISTCETNKQKSTPILFKIYSVRQSVTPSTIHVTKEACDHHHQTDTVAPHLVASMLQALLLVPCVVKYSCEVGLLRLCTLILPPPWLESGWLALSFSLLLEASASGRLQRKAQLQKRPQNSQLLQLDLQLQTVLSPPSGQAALQHPHHVRVINTQPANG